MLLLKANPELKIVFEKLIKTVKAPVTWKDVFAIKNNKLILVGEIRSLIFDFNDQTVLTNIVDISLENKKIDMVPNDALINNMLNIVLYAFGKWGAISGLTVEKDYVALNVLFQNVFRPIRVETEYGNERFLFLKNGVQITYEDVLQEAMELLRSEGKVPEDEQDTSAEEQLGMDTSENEEDLENKTAGFSEKDASYSWEDEEEYELGLWHSMLWKKETCTFEKCSQSESDAVKSRIGNNFYLTGYLCPKCRETLYMAVYPMDKELLIETEEARVFMARVYTCNTCNLFYTPRPGKLIQEGDVYGLKFDEDRVAYEDYLWILGKRAQKTVNSKFNEYEYERRKEKTEVQQEQTGQKESIEKESEQEESSRIENTQAENNSPVKQEKIRKKGFVKSVFAGNAGKEKEHNVTETEEAESRTKELREEEQIHEEEQVREKEQINSSIEKEKTDQNVSKSETSDLATMTKDKLAVKLAAKTTEELKNMLKGMSENEGAGATMAVKSGLGAFSETDVTPTEYMETVKNVLEEKLTAKYEARMGALDNLSLRQLSDLKKQIKEEDILPEEDRERYIKKLDNMLYRAEEKALEQKVELGRNKTYEEIGRMIDEVEKRDCPEELKEETIKKLKRIRSDRAEREVEHLIQNIPLHVDRKQLAVYLDKIDQYKEVDLTPYRKRLEERKDMAEREEIAAFVKRGGKKDRAELWTVYEQLQEQDYKKENKEPFLEKIYDKIRKMDEEEIDRICPSIASLSFREGMEAYKTISEGMFLPEIKTNALEMIDRRLVKLKTDESVQLMRKLMHEMEEKLTNLNGFYFYDAREEQRREKRQELTRWEEDRDEKISGNEEKQHIAMHRAVDGYAAAREPYEYPIIVGDTTKAGSGKEGFVLTPDHIFYRTLLSAGVINIMDIEKVEESRSIFGKGVYLWRFTGKKVKLPHPVMKEESGEFAKILNEFVSYLQERPDSRSIEYLAKEKHDVKCCYRCGYNYRGGNICPKCGSKMNN